mmetsp:Transcript_12234/g.35128  ORF Transcript_12234/g.35128 Transcript_12234/m.35128 type:complete len:571 (+) Transcript_12234:89-1801(+)
MAPDPWSRFADESLDGETVRSRADAKEKYKLVRDKDGRHYASGVEIATEKVTLVNRRLQSISTETQEVQTLTPEELVGDAQPQVDEATLVEFLRTTGPLMEEELGLAWNSSTAFEAYEPMWDDAGETCDMALQLWKEGLVDLQVTSVAWNCTGNTLACSLGRLETLGWCEVSAPVCLWNTKRAQLVANEPDLTIEVTNFVMCLAFHPTQPGLLAGGTYNGELMMWSTSSGELDPLVASSSIDDYFHREAIQKVEWISAGIAGKDLYLLATVSCDGKVLLWETRKNDLSFPMRGFSLLMRTDDPTRRRQLGGRALSFSPLDPFSFAVGCETGHMMLATRPQAAASMGKPGGSYTWRSSGVALLDQTASTNDRIKLQNHVENYCMRSGAKEVTAEVVFASKPDPVMLFPEPRRTDFESHAGAVTVMAFSPFHRKLLLSASVDGSVKIFQTLSDRALMTFYPPSKHLSTCAVSAAAWSPARPGVFAVAMEMGGVYVYDLMKSRHEPALELPISGGGNQRITSLMFNPKMLRLLAVGDEGGRMRVFRLPFDLTKHKKDEMAFVSRLMGTTAGKS